MYEIIGIAGSVFILISMSFESTHPTRNLWMRILNMTGSVLFIIYGLLIPAYSTAFLNCAMVCINSFYVHKLYNTIKQE